MHIGIHTLGMPLGNTGGLQTYTEDLIRALAKIDPVNDYTIFVHKDAGDHYRVNNPNFKVVPCNIRQDWLRWSVIWRNSFFYSILKKSKIDLLHSPANLAPFFLPCPSVLTLHDAISFEYPSSVTTFLKRHFWPLALKRGAREASKIITGSHDSKRQILRHIPIEPQKIEVIYHGSPSFSVEDSSKKESLAKPYVLWVGKTMAHKNLIRLIQAYALLVKTKNIPHLLYLVGMKGYHHQRVMEEIERLELRDRVLFLGFCERSQLKYFYENASLFVFPSLVEGFGLPLLEAMSCRIPVITSNRRVMKEIAEDAAYLVDPENVENIAQGMWKVISSPDLHNQLVLKGQERVKQFSWEKCAAKTLKVYQAVIRLTYVDRSSGVPNPCMRLFLKDNKSGDIKNENRD